MAQTAAALLLACLLVAMPFLCWRKAGSVFNTEGARPVVSFFKVWLLLAAAKVGALLLCAIAIVVSRDAATLVLGAAIPMLSPEVLLYFPVTEAFEGSLPAMAVWAVLSALSGGGLAAFLAWRRVLELTAPEPLRRD